jgi:hypothetical protein
MGYTKFWRENVKEENTWRVLYWEYDIKMELIELRGGDCGADQWWGPVTTVMHWHDL